MGIRRRSALVVLALGLAGPAAAQALNPGLSGAWATSEPDCKKIFTRSGGGFAFRQPVDKFAQAAIISPGTVVLPSQTCHVTKSSTANGVTSLSFDCKDSISYTSQSVDIETKTPGELIYRPNGDKTLDTTLVRCK
jgi:hypothetical protein